MFAIVVIAILIAINALYVAAEFSAVSVRTSRIQAEADAGGRLARRLLPFLVDARALDRYVAACQIGITFSSIVVGAYAQSKLAPAMVPLFQRFGSMQEAAAQSSAAVVVLIGLTALQMVLGELVPKSLALQWPTKVALWTVVPMQWSLRMLAWFIHVLNGSGVFVLRLFGMAESGHRHVHSPDEIAMLIAESGERGLLKPNEHLRLQHALRLGDRPARELMVPRTAIVALDADASIAEARRVAQETPYTRFPVFEGTIDNIIGLVHVRDIATADGRATGTIRGLVRQVTVAPESLSADRILARLKQERRTMAVLVDEYGGTAGLLTVDDILDDLIGDIADEFRKSEPHPQVLPDGRVRLPGTMAADDAAEWTGVHWKHRASTVGGLVLERLRRIPEAGERLAIDGVDTVVERVAHNAVASVLVTPVRRAEPGARHA